MTSSPPAFGLSLILGAGAVGGLVADCLRRCSSVVQKYDRRPRRDAQRGDALAPTPPLAQALSRSDLVLLALPERVLCDALPVVLQHVAPTALVVETGAAKIRMQSLVATLPRGPELLGINPLFAPAMGFVGQNVSITRYSGGPKTDLFESCMREWGAKILPLSARVHDESMAIVQAAVHAAVLSFGGTLADAPVGLQNLLTVATPPFRALLLLLGRILSQTPEVYWDIQSSNTFAARARSKLAAELSRCDQFATDPNGLLDFETWLGHMKNALKPLQPTVDVGANQLMSCATNIFGQRPC